MPKKATSAKPRPLYRSKPPKGRAALPRSQVEQQLDPTNNIGHLISSAHFTLREDGSIQPQPSIEKRADDHSPSPDNPSLAGAGEGGRRPGEGRREKALQSGEGRGEGGSSLPKLIFQSDSPFIRLYHGNSLELLDAIYSKYPDGRFDANFADPPYFLSNGGITCHAGKMVKVDKGDWDVSRGPELNHEFNTEWLRRCQRVLKPNGTIWVTGTHHVIFSIGYAMQQLGYKILNDIAWEKPNPPPNLSCRYFTHSTETVLWAAKNEKSKHVFNYQEMRKVTGKQMKTVWRKEEFSTEDNKEVGSSHRDDRDERTAGPAVPTQNEDAFVPSVSFCSNVWTLGAPGRDEKEHGKHPTQKPVTLVERCLLASTRENDLVLDPFVGGGTTAIACIRLKRGFIGIELDFAHLCLAQRRADREIIEIWLRHFRVRIDVSVCGVESSRCDDRSAQRADPTKQIDLAIFPDSINGSRRMAGVPEIQAERIFHETKFVFLSCAQVERGAVVHTTVDVSLQEAWAKTPTGKKRETTHIVRCETEIFRITSAKSS